MPEKSLEDLFRSPDNEESRTRIQREKRIAEWNQEVSALFDEIDGWLPDNERTNRVRKKVTVFEPRLGQYEIESMRIPYSSVWLDLVPFGTTIIGSRGRVDLKGPQMALRLVLVKDSEWGVVFEDPRKPERLTPEVLTRAMKLALFGIDD